MDIKLEVVCLEADEFAETPEVKTAIHSNAMHCCDKFGGFYNNNYSLIHFPSRCLKAKSVPDSCCHLERSGCGNRKIQQFTSENYFNLEIWKDGCLQILQVKMKNDVEPALMVYAGVGVLLAIVELITVVLACAFVAQLGRRRRRELGQWDRTVAADEYLPSLTSKETNF